MESLPISAQIASTRGDDAQIIAAKSNNGKKVVSIMPIPTVSWQLLQADSFSIIAFSDDPSGRCDEWVLGCGGGCHILAAVLVY